MACEYYKSATLMGLTPSTLQQQCLEGSQWHSSTLLRWHRLHDLDRTKHKAKGCYYDTTEADHCMIEKIIRPIHPAEAVNTVQPLQCRKLSCVSCLVTWKIWNIRMQKDDKHRMKEVSWALQLCSVFVLKQINENQINWSNTARLSRWKGDYETRPGPKINYTE